MNTQTLLTERIVFKKYQFAINPEYNADRTGNYELRDKIKEKWDNYHLRLEGNGNIHTSTQFNVEKQTFEFLNEWSSDSEKHIPMYNIMSPALLLYRLISTFFGSPKCYDGYKTIWEYNLIHKETGKGISFSEWKGAIGFWLPDVDHNKLNKHFKNDLIELLNYLASNECAHPYDGLVAGSIA